VAASGAATVAAIADVDEGRARSLAEPHEAAAVVHLDALLELDLDGVVIATPSGHHAAQAIAALGRGCAVFCQKPLGRSGVETRRVVDAARAADRLLGVDLCYRRTASFEAVRELLRNGALGRVFAVDLVFHNAWAPNQDWAFERERSGGGCLIDLGIHLVDLALVALDWPEARAIEARLFAGGAPLGPDGAAVEDYAVATLDLGGAATRLACSWNLHGGKDAEIGAWFHGTDGGATWRNVGGSFHDFVAEQHRGNACTTLVDPPDAWGGRTILDWVRRLSESRRFDPGAEGFVRDAEALDAIYEAGASDVWGVAREPSAAR
jgi:predicted dehydrogenase